MRYMTVQLLFLLALGSCASPPKPPTVDESRKRPANAAVEVELQSCRSALQNTRIAANESQRAAAAAVASATQLAQAVGAPSSRNVVYAVLFPYGGTRAQVGSAEAARLRRGGARGTAHRSARPHGRHVRDDSRGPHRPSACRVRPGPASPGRDRAGPHPHDLAAGRRSRGRQRLARRPGSESAGRDRDLPRGAAGARHAGLLRIPDRRTTLLPNPPSARTSMEASFTDDRRPGGTVEPANRVAVAKQHFQAPEEPAVERFELRDPFAEVTYRTRTIAEMAAKAEQLGATRFHAVAPDGRRTPVVKVDGELATTRGSRCKAGAFGTNATRAICSQPWPLKEPLRRLLQRSTRRPSEPRTSIASKRRCTSAT